MRYSITILVLTIVKHWMFDNILALKRLEGITCRSLNGIEKFLQIPYEKFTCVKNFANSF